VDLLHVIESFWKNWASSGLYEKEVNRRLAIWQEKISPRRASNKRLHIQKGRPSEAIIWLADSLGHKLIILGGEKKGFREGFLTGSTTKNVVHNAKQSVWLCKKSTIKNILIGIDSYHPNKLVVEKALELEVPFAQELLVHGRAEFVKVFEFSRHTFSSLHLACCSVAGTVRFLHATLQRCNQTPVQSATHLRGLLPSAERWQTVRNH